MFRRTNGRVNEICIIIKISLSKAYTEKQQQRLEVQLYERLASLGIMRDKLKAPPETPRTSQHYRIEGIMGALN